VCCRPMKGKTTYSIAETSEAGFSTQLDELINDQGELAVIVEGSDDQYKLLVMFTKQGDSFDNENEVRNVFLAQSMEIQFMKTVTERSCPNIWIP
jgi:hypothetical protein